MVVMELLVVVMEFLVVVIELFVVVWLGVGFLPQDWAQLQQLGSLPPENMHYQTNFRIRVSNKWISHGDGRVFGFLVF